MELRSGHVSLLSPPPPQASANGNTQLLKQINQLRVNKNMRQTHWSQPFLPQYNHNKDTKPASERAGESSAEGWSSCSSSHAHQGAAHSSVSLCVGVHFRSYGFRAWFRVYQELAGPSSESGLPRPPPGAAGLLLLEAG